MKELLLGCGAKQAKDIVTNGTAEFINPVKLDINPDHKPDVVWDLNIRPLPFQDNEFDEIHAYEVLEHIGKQGDYKGFFAEFEEYHRILKSNGLLVASVPMWNSVWAWGDPSHVRVINSGTIVFLSQKQYQAQIGRTPMTDFRYMYKADFDIEGMQESDDRFYFILKAIK